MIIPMQLGEKSYEILLEPGCLSGGTRYDERLYLDRIASDLQEAAVALLAW